MFSTLQRTMIIWTTILVVVLGGVAASLMLDPPSTLKGQKTARSKPAVLPMTGREPASFHRAVALDESQTRQAVELKLPCPSAASSGENSGVRDIFSPAVTQLRITGEACGSTREITSSEVINESNGFSATVFLPTPRQFTTDYIALAPGTNLIRIAHVLKNGMRETREYTIERGPALEKE